MAKPPALWLLVVLALAISCYTDNHTKPVPARKIKNWVTFPLWGVGLISSIWLDGWSGLFLSLLGSIIALSAALLGGPAAGVGDQKLLIALGAWFTYPAAWVFWAWLAIVRLIDGIAIRLIASGFNPGRFWRDIKLENIAVMSGQRPKPPQSLPGAYMISAAAGLAYWWLL